jgi:uncharacterized protein (DUF924 family)
MAEMAEMAEIDSRAAEVVRFWRDAGSDAWFRKDAEFDARFHDACGEHHFAAARREFDAWIESPYEAFALMILLDQFPRNCFRGTGHMYATDPLARFFARKALAAGHHQTVDQELRPFFVLPFMHSEIMDDQQLCVELSRPLGEETLKYAIHHRDIIQQFGRFPHRNPMLGRDTTPAEHAFLEGGGFAG